MMRTPALVLFACVLLPAAAPAASFAQTRPQESAADAAARKAREAEEAAAKRLAEAQRKRQAAREEAQGKQGDKPAAGDAPRRGDAPARSRPDKPSDAASDVPRKTGDAPRLDEPSDRPGDAAPAANPAELRRMRAEIFALERVHRERTARIERLKVLFREKGETEKVLRLEQMGERAEIRYQGKLAAYRREMGPENFAKLEAALEAGRKGGRGRPGAEEGRGNAERRSNRASDKATPGDRPGTDRRATDQPRRDRAGGDKPKADRPRSDKPNAGRPQADKPARRKPGGNGRGSV